MTTTACTYNCIYVKLSVKWCHCSLWKVSCIRNIWQTSLFSSQRMINWSMQNDVPGVKRRWDEDIVILLTCVCLYCPYLLYYYKLITILPCLLLGHCHHSYYVIVSGGQMWPVGMVTMARCAAGHRVEQDLVLVTNSITFLSFIN